MAPCPAAASVERDEPILDTGDIQADVLLGINMKRTKDALEMDVIEKIRELFKKHGILNSSHNVPQRDTPIAEDYYQHWNKARKGIEAAVGPRDPGQVVNCSTLLSMPVTFPIKNK